MLGVGWLGPFLYNSMMLPCLRSGLGGEVGEVDCMRLKQLEPGWYVWYQCQHSVCLPQEKVGMWRDWALGQGEH